MDRVMGKITGRGFLAGVMTGLIVLAIAPGFSSMLPKQIQAAELDPVQNSVISTDLFLNWLPSQQKELGLTNDQVRELRDIQVNFRLKSQDLGKEMGRIAGSLSKKVSVFPIPLQEVKPEIQRLSDLRGEVTFSAISSLAHVQGILKKEQWDKARQDWSTLLSKQSTSKSPEPAH